MNINQELFAEAWNNWHSEVTQNKEDCERIVRIANDHFEIDISLRQAEVIWSEYSDSHCAGWLMLTYDQIVEAIIRFVDLRINK